MPGTDTEDNYTNNQELSRIAQLCGCLTTDVQSYATIEKVKKTCQTYRNIDLYVVNSRGARSTSIVNLYKIKRHGERQPFPSSNYRMILWHGTKPAYVPGIIQHGFKKGSGGLFGGGIYLADRIEKSLGYVGTTSANTAYYFLVEADLGRVYKAHHTHSDYKVAPPGFHTVKGNGRMIPTWKDNKDYYGAIMPCGATRPNQRHTQYDLNLNEYILYDSNRLIIRFLVECTH